MKKNAEIRVYLASFYEKNRLCCFSAGLMYILDALFMLVVSWLLGVVLDAISVADSGELLHLVWVSAVILAAMLAVNLLLQLTKNSFVCNGICSYRSGLHPADQKEHQRLCPGKHFILSLRPDQRRKQH